MDRSATIDALIARFPQVKTSEFRGDMRAVVPADQIFDLRLSF